MLNIQNIKGKGKVRVVGEWQLEWDLTEMPDNIEPLFFDNGDEFHIGRLTTDGLFMTEVWLVHCGETRVLYKGEVLRDSKDISEHFSSLEEMVKAEDEGDLEFCENPWWGFHFGWGWYLSDFFGPMFQKSDVREAIREWIKNMDLFIEYVRK